jgi:hypothetical protein
MNSKESASRHVKNWVQVELVRRLWLLDSRFLQAIINIEKQKVQTWYVLIRCLHVLPNLLAVSKKEGLYRQECLLVENFNVLDHHCHKIDFVRIQ